MTNRQTNNGNYFEYAKIHIGARLAPWLIFLLKFLHWAILEYWLFYKEAVMVAKTERISVRVPENVHALLSRAAGALGSSMNQFVLQTAIERAKQVVEDENIIRLNYESSQLFFDALENAPEPNDKLKQAALAHQALLNASH